MSRVPRAQQRSIDSTRQIVAAARERFIADGFDLASIEMIAADCGRTKGAVYHHFASKEDLFETVFQIEQRSIADIVIRKSVATDPVISLQRGASAYLSAIARDTGAARITLLEAPAVLGWARWRSCDGGPFRVMLRDALQSISAAGRLIDGLDPEPLTELLLGAITEAALAVATSAAGAERLRRTTRQLIALVATD